MSGMTGNFFKEIINGKITAQGFIQEQVGLGFYKVAFVPPHPQKAFSKILPVERLVNFVLFSTREEMDAWIESVSEQAGTSETAPAPEATPRARKPRAKAAKKAASNDA